MSVPSITPKPNQQSPQVLNRSSQLKLRQLPSQEVMQLALNQLHRVPLKIAQHQMLVHLSLPIYVQRVLRYLLVSKFSTQHQEPQLFRYRDLQQQFRDLHFQ